MEGPINKTATIEKAFLEINVEPNITNWLIKMLKSRLIIPEVDATQSTEEQPGAHHNEDSFLHYGWW